ncbi:MAG TPA: hypothetical protein DCS09_00620 [Porphyromonadaceae bacterium]|nr:hypothetical protein [Porphyromonadaceae bacterium]
MAVKVAVEEDLRRPALSIQAMRQHAQIPQDAAGSLNLSRSAMLISAVIAHNTGMIIPAV